MSHRLYITPEREATIRKMRAEEKSIQEIALVLNVNHKLVSAWVKTLGLPLFKSKRGPANGKDRDDPKILELWNLGVTYTKIADIIEANEDFVRTRIRCMRAAGLEVKNHTNRRYAGASKEQKKPDPTHEYAPKTRACLRCQAKMISKWPGERVCVRCKSSSAWRGGDLEW